MLILNVSMRHSCKYALAKEIFDLVHQTGSLRNKVASGDETSSCSQEFITGRVCNSYMVSTPAIWIG